MRENRVCPGLPRQDRVAGRSVRSPFSDLFEAGVMRGTAARDVVRQLRRKLRFPGQRAADQAPAAKTAPVTINIRGYAKGRQSAHGIGNFGRNLSGLRPAGSEKITRRRAARMASFHAPWLDARQHGHQPGHHAAGPTAHPPRHGSVGATLTEQPCIVRVQPALRVSQRSSSAEQDLTPLSRSRHRGFIFPRGRLAGEHPNITREHLACV